MTVADGENGRDRNSEKNARNATQLRTAQDRQDDRERMQMNAVAHQARIHHIIVGDAQHGQEEEHGSGLACGVEARDHTRRQREHQRSNQRNEFEESREEPKHEGVRHPEAHEANRADRADQHTGNELRPDVRGKSEIDILDEFSAMPAQLPERK